MTRPITHPERFRGLMHMSRARGAWMRKAGQAAVVVLSGLLYLTALGLIVFIFFVLGPQ